MKRPAAKLPMYNFAVGKLVQPDLIGPIKGDYDLPVSDRPTAYTVCRVVKYKSEVSAKPVECLCALLNMLKLKGK